MGRGRRSKTPGQTSESNPNPTATSPSASTPTGDATTQLFLLAPSLPSLPRGGHPQPTYLLLPFFHPNSQITFLLPSSASSFATTTTTPQFIPWAPPLPILSRGHHHHPACPLAPFFLHPTSQSAFLLPYSASPSAPWTTTTTHLIPLAPLVPNLSWEPPYPLLPFFHPTPQITFLLPFFASPSAPWTATTQHIPLAPPVPNLSWGRHHPPNYSLPPFLHPTPHQITSLLRSSPPRITATTQPLPVVPPQPIRKTHQERVSCTSDGATTTDHAGPSTAPAASAASTDDFMSLFAPAVEGVMAAVRGGKKEHSAGLLLIMVAALYGLRLDEMESTLKCLVGLVEQMKGNAELKAALEALADVEVRESTARAAEILLAERKKRDGSGAGSCSGSKGAAGGPNSGSGEGDGEGGGVSV